MVRALENLNIILFQVDFVIHFMEEIDKEISEMKRMFLISW